MSMGPKPGDPNYVKVYLMQEYLEANEECSHEEHDHGICLECEKDITQELVAAAESAFEGER